VVRHRLARLLRRASAIGSSNRLGLGSPFGLNQSRFMARWIGWILVVATVTAAIAVLFPAAPFADVPLSVITTVVAGVAALILLLGALDHVPAPGFQLVLALTTALAALGVYSGGSPTSGAEFFFLWASPLAFAFFSTRQALLQVAWIGAAYGAVLTVQLHLHPKMGSAGLIIGMWFIVMTTAVAIGILMQRISRSLRDVDRRFEFAFSESPIGAGFLDRDLVWLEVNERLCEILRTPRAALVGSSIRAMSHVGDGGLTESILDRLSGETARFRTRFSLPDSSTVWASIAAAVISPEIGEPYIFCQVVDVTEFIEAREALARHAIHDPLTGLFNRALFADRLQSALRNRPTRGGEVAVAMLDLDHFNVVNDSLGHQAGDELLAALAPRLLAEVEPSDTLARFGGDEFVLLCEGIRNPLDAVDRASRLAMALHAPVSLSTGSGHVVTASIGIAVASGTETLGDSLLRDADAAMYRAKAGGRNRIEMFDQSMRELAMARLQLEGELRRALEHDELYLEYQPVVDVESGRPVLLEALARWHHPTRGTLAASEFIPIAEETGLIAEIGEHVLVLALSTLARLQREIPSDPPLRMSVNVSGRQLAIPSFPETVAAHLRNVEIIPQTLALEITESVLLTSHLPASTLNALKGLGIDLMLDDFGTGYSSLAYLKQFPIDVLKIDQSFVAGLAEGTSRALFEAILAMGRALSLEVIAEGAEDEAHLEVLRELGCELVQGHAISRPLPAERIGKFLLEQRALANGLESGAT
jgi:diguanylate cyclase (GGDEF)-like protein/PAS domain S-box-containing protein